MNIRSPNAERRAKLVTCLQGAHLCPNKSDFFLGVTHLLQSGGTLLLTAPLKSSRTCALLASLKKITQKTEWQSCFKSQDFEKEYVPFESTAALEELLKQNHFLNVEIEVEQNIPRFQNAKALTKYIAQDLQVFNTFRVLTGEQKEQFSNAVTAEYLAQIPSSPDGTIQFPQITVIAKAIYHPYNFFSGSWPVYSPKKRHTP